jgi:hypothetical protein
VHVFFGVSSLTIILHQTLLFPTLSLMVGLLIQARKE